MVPFTLFFVYGFPSEVTNPKKGALIVLWLLGCDINSIRPGQLQGERLNGHFSTKRGPLTVLTVVKGQITYNLNLGSL